MLSKVEVLSGKNMFNRPEMAHRAYCDAARSLGWSIHREN